MSPFVRRHAGPAHAMPPRRDIVVVCDAGCGLSWPFETQRRRIQTLPKHLVAEAGLERVRVVCLPGVAIAG